MHPLIAVPVTLLLIIRSYRRKSLTIPGIAIAALTASIHALHPSPLPFTLLVTFFLLGTTATKVKHDIKATLTLSSTGSTGGENTRTSIQVLANSGVASALTLVYLLRYGSRGGSSSSSSQTPCFGGEDKFYDMLITGIIANYAAVTADTLSSELGILSKSKPRLITAPWKVVPPGTNGGVTFAGLVSGATGSILIGITSILLLKFCDPRDYVNIQMIGHKPAVAEWTISRKAYFVLAVGAWGTLGSILDSVLGAVLQASVVDRRTGKVVEGAGGVKVLVSPGNAVITRTDTTKGAVGDHESRVVYSGQDILDNNQVNLLMAFLMSIGGMVVAGLITGVSSNDIHL